MVLYTLSNDLRATLEHKQTYQTGINGYIVFNNNKSEQLFLQTFT